MNDQVFGVHCSNGFCKFDSYTTTKKYKIMTRNELKKLWFSVPKQNKIECKVIVINTKSDEVKIISDVDNYYHSKTITVNNSLNYALNCEEYKVNKYQLIIK